MTDIRPGTSTQSQFFTKGNEAMLDRLLNGDFQRRIGGELTEKQKERLNKTVKHYMTEVYAKNSGQSLQYLNKEVLSSVVPDYMGYLRRNAGPISEEDANTDSNGIRMDVNSRFDQLQLQRQDRGVAPPAAPDFRMSLEDAGPTPLSQFEEIKRQREMEAERITATSQEIVISTTVQKDSPMGRFVDSDSDFRSSSDASRQRDQLALIMREAERAAGISGGRAELPALPDPRRLLLGDSMVLPPRAQGIATASPTTALPDRIAQRPVLPQDFLRSQDDIVAYKETEHNLFIYSADRNWVVNTQENRYNFSVTFDPANNQPGFGYTTATNVKFKNIVRIEFVKAIMPTESFDVLMTGTSGVPTPGLNTNILSFPYVQVRIPELNVNGYGTNDGMNNAFAAISYDAYWTSDSVAQNKGYARMIPKFLKCQKVYYPTPLATLQKLTFEIQRPDGTPVSTTSDSLTVSMVLMPDNNSSSTNYESTKSTPVTSSTSNIAPTAGGSVTLTMASGLGYTAGQTVLVSNTSGTNNFNGVVSSYSGTSLVVSSINTIVGSTFGSSTYTVAVIGYEWLWLQTSTYFSQFLVSQGDRIVLKAVNFNSTLLTYPGMQDLVNYLTQPQGILVSAIGRSTGGTAGYTDGANTAGYANSIIVRNSFQDPTLGLTGVSPWVANYATTLLTFANASGSITISPVVGGSVTLTGLASGLPYVAGMQVLVTGATTTNSFTGTVTSYSSTTMVVGSIAFINGGFTDAAIYTVRAGMVPSAGRLINMNRQIQIIMRVITRDMDSAAKLRPDNLQA